VRPRKRLIAAGALVAGLLLLTACAPTPARVPSAVAARQPLYVVRRSWHTDIGFRARDLRPPLASVLHFFPGAEAVVFGFGDRHYVLSKDKTFMEMVVAMLPGQGLILTTGLSVPPQRAFGNDQVVTFAVTSAQSDAVQAFVWDSLQRDAGGVVRAFAPGPYGGAVYFASPATYDFAHTCNTWTAEGLRAGDLPIRSFGVLFAGQLWAQVQDAVRQSPDALPLAASSAAPAGRLPP
jgi:hypothetical protein